jgi:hypothetical protein
VISSQKRAHFPETRDWVSFIGSPNVIMDGRDIYWEPLTTGVDQQKPWKRFSKRINFDGGNKLKIIAIQFNQS